jgi:hypothetical protein
LCTGLVRRFLPGQAARRAMDALWVVNAVVRLVRPHIAVAADR